ncbi:hypothetical protein K504DRAFT_449582 [Pleomassaria siparia CBS 279.74]|uniref:Actin-like ATPase domain-containing protein n=1 Tax=Pleomassaria siparia CBS 279.74 TaxID=1314801 RepID=A0A6G1JW84_9PLEO|nr:hypothetical protein K504DRAFT_449582 [Pleomassaria siparia CBS 279.74]
MPRYNASTFDPSSPPRFRPINEDLHRRPRNTRIGTRPSRSTRGQGSIQTQGHAPLDLPTTRLRSARLRSDDTRERNVLSPSQTPTPVAIDTEATSPTTNNVYKVCVDFGTTFSTVAYTLPGFTGDIDDIFTIPGPGDCNPTEGDRQIPTASWYPVGPVTPSTHKRPVFDMNSEVGAMPGFLGTGATSSRNLNDTVCPGYLHGHGVEKEFTTTTLNSKTYRAEDRLLRTKLLLDESVYTERLRQELRELIIGIVPTEFEIIRDYLTVLYLLVKQRLQRAHDFDAESQVEFVVTVPVCWTPFANMRMTECVLSALKEADFGIPHDGSTINLFIVNEAEAAATYVIQHRASLFKRLEVFILMDCGGGTVDLGTYKLARDEPPRLEWQVNSLSGGLYGSSYVNQKFERVVEELLSEQREHLESVNKSTLAVYIAQEMMPRFENVYKRTIDFSDLDEIFKFKVSGLRPSKTDNRLKEDALLLTWQVLRSYLNCVSLINNLISLNSGDMLRIFEDCLKGIHGMMKYQIIQAVQEKGVEVDKVLLVGGFADSPALCNYLTQGLKKINEEMGLSIQLIIPQRLAAPAVAKGALVRSADKENGPNRIPDLGIAVLRHIPYQTGSRFRKQYPELDQALQAGEPTISELDGKKYVADTLHWIIKAGVGPIGSVHKASFQVDYFIGIDDPPSEWIRKESLFISRTCNEDNYQQHHAKNKDKYEKLGKLELDLVSLRSENLPQRRPTPGIGLPHYKITVSHEWVIIDRDLRFNVYWPSKPMKGIERRLIPGSGFSFNIAGIFGPGTK